MPTIHTIRLKVSRAQGVGESVLVTDVLWRKADLPSRAQFYEAVERAYASIELPWFPSRAYVEVETETAIKTAECEDPVDEPGSVALALWSEMARIGSGQG